MINTLTFPSKSLGAALRTLLSINLIIAVFVLVFTIIYAFAYDTYLRLFASIDQTLSTFLTILNVIAILVYLCWIVQVQRALREIYPEYPIGGVGSIVRMLPVVNIWGIGSTFSAISAFLYRRQATHRAAGTVEALIVPLYIAVFGGNFLNRLIWRDPADASDGLVLIATAVDAASLGIYLLLTVVIHRAVTQLHASRMQAAAADEAAPAAGDAQVEDAESASAQVQA